MDAAAYKPAMNDNKKVDSKVEFKAIQSGIKDLDNLFNSQIEKGKFYK